MSVSSLSKMDLAYLKCFFKEIVAYIQISVTLASEKDVLLPLYYGCYLIHFILYSLSRLKRKIKRAFTCSKKPQIHNMLLSQNQ